MRRSEMRSERGQSTVEFALVLPMVLLVLVGLITFGKAFNYWINLNHIANEGARWAVVNKLPGNATPTTAQLVSYESRQLSTQELQTDLATNGGSIKFCYVGSGGTGTPLVGDPATVTFTAKYAMPFQGMFKLFGAQYLTLTGKATMRLEQIPTWTKSAGCP